MGRLYADHAAGGQAVPAVGSVSDGEKIIAQAVAAYGTVHVLINNAGILREYRHTMQFTKPLS